MARILKEILKDYDGLYISEENAKYQKMSEFIKVRMPDYLKQENNNDFYVFIDKLLTFHNKLLFWNWILESQFSLYTAKGKFLDNLGRWQGLSRPPLPSKRTNEPVVIFPTKDMSPQQLKEFNELHGLTGEEGVDTDTQRTFFPATDFIGEVLVNDNEYRIYIQGMLQLKKGLSLPTIIDVFTRVLRKPFFITKHSADVLTLTAAYDEDAIRLVLTREMTSRLRTTGFDIEVLQATEANPPEIANKYGDGCFNQENPYFENDDEDNNEEGSGGIYDKDTYVITHPDIPVMTIGGSVDVIIESDASDFTYKIISGDISIDRTNNVLHITGNGVGTAKVEIIAQAYGRNPIAHTMSIIVEDIATTELLTLIDDTPTTNYTIRELDNVSIKIQTNAKTFEYLVNGGDGINIEKSNMELNITALQVSEPSIIIKAQAENQHENQVLFNLKVIPNYLLEQAWKYYRVALTNSKDLYTLIGETRDLDKELPSKIIDFYTNDKILAVDTYNILAKSKIIDGVLTKEQVNTLIDNKIPIPDDLKNFDWTSIDNKEPYYG